MKGKVDSADVRFPPPLIYIGALAIGIILGRALGVPSLGLGEAARQGLAALLLVGGLGIIIAGAGMFRRLGTAVIPHKPASRLVTSGIYRWTRNPMYLGMAVAYAGVAVLFDSLVSLLLLPIVLFLVQTQVIAKEEAYLERAFGNAYLQYKQRARRWL